MVNAWAKHQLKPEENGDTGNDNQATTPTQEVSNAAKAFYSDLEQEVWDCEDIVNDKVTTRAYIPAQTQALSKPIVK